MSGRKRAEARIRVSAHGGSKRVYAEVAGKDVSRLYIVPQRIRAGPAALVRMAGIAGVGTRREFRRKGLAARVYARTMAEIRRDGYPCSGLFTGTGIVAHRLYRRFGFVDINIELPATKLLDPEAAVRKAIGGLLDDEALAGWRCALEVRLEGHRPLYLRIDGGKARVLKRRPRQVDLSLSMSSTTFGLWEWGRLTPEYAEAAGLVSWRGKRDHWQRLAAALRGRHGPVHVG